METLKITGSQFNYFFHCKRELWFFSKQVKCEQDSELVHQGKIIHEFSYREKRKEYNFGSIKVDWLDLKNMVIHEVKKSDKAEKAHIWQLKYYIYYLDKIGAGKFTGQLNYPKMKKSLTFDLKESDYPKIEKYLEEIDGIIRMESPPPKLKHITPCKKCSYYELCYI